MRLRRPPRALLIDFDGVLRLFDRPDPVEERYGLAPGAFLAAGLEWKRYIPAVTGAWTRAQWVASIAEATGAPASALAEWESYRGYICEPVLEFVRSLRAAGVPVGLATNATDDLRDDLALLGVSDEFDAVISSAELGRHKPSREFFVAACGALGVPANECLFVDDTDRNIRGARVAGLPAMRWSGVDDLRYLRMSFATG